MIDGLSFVGLCVLCVVCCVRCVDRVVSLVVLRLRLFVCCCCVFGVCCLLMVRWLSSFAVLVADCCLQCLVGCVLFVAFCVFGVS